MLTRMHSHAGAWERDKRDWNGNRWSGVSSFWRKPWPHFLMLLAVFCSGNLQAVDEEGHEACTYDEKNGPQMVVIDSGVFLMGSPEDEKNRDSNEDQHQVAIVKPFALGRCEVSFDEYDRFAKETGRQLPNDQGWGRGKRPVINVSWDDAVAYTDWLSMRTGQNYRLPTEAEWEYAARSGTTTRYSWGDTIDCTKAQYGDCKQNSTVSVGSFPPNPFGLHDMHGNVWEWTLDCWNASYDGAPADGNARDSGDCTRRVLRGGSWGNRPRNRRSAGRSGGTPDSRGSGIGFRLARTL